MTHKTILIIGDYEAGFDPHDRLLDAIEHASVDAGVVVNTRWVGNDDLATRPHLVTDAAGVVLAPRATKTYRVFPEPTVQALRLVRERNVPFLATGDAHDLVLIEVARNVMGMKDAGSRFFDEDAADPVVKELPKRRSRHEARRRRSTCSSARIPCCSPSCQPCRARGDRRPLPRHQPRLRLRARGGRAASGRHRCGLEPPAPLRLRAEPLARDGGLPAPDAGSIPGLPHPLFAGLPRARRRAREARSVASAAPLSSPSVKREVMQRDLGTSNASSRASPPTAAASSSSATTRKKSRTAGVENGRVEVATTRHREGVGVRVIEAGCFGYASCGSTDPADVRAAIERARAAARDLRRAARASAWRRSRRPSSSAATSRARASPSATSKPFEAKVELARGMEAHARAAAGSHQLGDLRLHRDLRGEGDRHERRRRRRRSRSSAPSSASPRSRSRTASARSARGPSARPAAGTASSGATGPRSSPSERADRGRSLSARQPEGGRRR